jgi:hypothetical protein
MANPPVECEHHDNPEILVCLSDPRLYADLQYKFLTTWNRLKTSAASRTGQTS